MNYTLRGIPEKNPDKPVISIITPAYNVEKFIADTINSVLNQTFTDWEMLIVDDCSNDQTSTIVNNYIKSDKRVKYFKTISASGSPTLPRNIGISLASGYFIAFLDSDDLWLPEKLEKQIALFEDKNVAIAFSDYEKIDENGFGVNRFIIAPNIVSYNDLLKGNVIACSTVIYDVGKVGKCEFTKQGHEDYALWLSILKNGFIAKNCEQITMKYRVRKGSISANKIKAISWVWTIYRKNEQLSILKSLKYLTYTLTKSLLKYLK